MATRKHILFLPQWFPNKTDIQLGGFIRQQIRVVAPYYNCSVIYVHPIPNQVKEFELTEEDDNGIRTLIVYYKQSKGLFRKIINYKRYKIAQELAYAKLNNHFDLVHVHVPLRCSLLAMNHLKKVPLIATEHWSGHLNGQYNSLGGIEKKIYTQTIKSAEARTVVSLPLQEAFTRNTGLDATIIGNIIKGKPENIPLIKDTINILSVGDLNNETKNYTGLLTAFCDSLKVHKNLKLDIIGEGPDRKIIEQLIVNLDLADSVMLLGRKSQNQVLDSYTNYHLFVSFSNTETFGMAIAEAIACGRPVIATRCGGPETFINAENGVLVDPENNAQLVHGIHQVIQALNKYNPYNMSAIMLQEFGEEAVKLKWLNLYKKVLDDSKS